MGTNAEWVVGLGPLVEPAFLLWLEVHHTGPFTLSDTIHKCGVGVGLKLPVCSLEVQSSNQVPFLSCFIRIMFMELPGALECRRLARISDTAPPLQK